MTCTRERQRQRDAAAKTVRQEAQAARRVEEVATNKYEETQELVSSLTPLGSDFSGLRLNKTNLLGEVVIKCHVYLSKVAALNWSRT